MCEITVAACIDVLCVLCVNNCTCEIRCIICGFALPCGNASSWCVSLYCRRVLCGALLQLCHAQTDSLLHLPDQASGGSLFYHEAVALQRVCQESGQNHQVVCCVCWGSCSSVPVCWGSCSTIT